MHTNTPTVLVDMIYGYLNSVEHDGLSRFLANWPSKPFKTRKAAKRMLPVLTQLPGIEVNTDKQSAAVVKAIQSLAEHLCWRQTYTAEDFGERFLENYGWTELIGLRGPVASRDIACGFLLLGPNTEYPKHSHAAEEVYVPFSTQALWIQGDGDWTARQRGVPSYHSPWTAHGMRTGPSPLLALYIWQGGNLAQKSTIEPQSVI